MHERLQSTYAKLDRASAHSAELSAAIEKWLGSEPWQITSKKLYPAGTETWSFLVEPIPVEIDCIAADAIHNIRAPLDKMLTAYMSLAIGKADRPRYPGIGFPSRETSKKYTDAIKDLGKKGLPSPALDFLGRLEPYPGGADGWLFELHNLDLENKHYAALMPITAGARTTNVREVRVHGGRILRLGSSRGRHLVALDPVGPGPNHLAQERVDLQPVYQEQNGRGYLEFTVSETDFEFMTTTIGARLEGDIAPGLSVALAAADGSSLGEAISTIGTFLSLTRALVEEFEKALLP